MLLIWTRPKFLSTFKTLITSKKLQNHSDRPRKKKNKLRNDEFQETTIYHKLSCLCLNVDFVERADLISCLHQLPALLYNCKINRILFRHRYEGCPNKS